MSKKQLALTLMVVLLLSVTVCAKAGSSPVDAYNTYSVNRILSNPESFIMGTQYDRRLGNQAESMRNKIYDILTTYFETISKIANPAAQLPTFSSRAEIEYLAINDNRCRDMILHLNKLGIYPDQIAQISQLDASGDFYRARLQEMFSVDHVWYVYDTSDWDYLYLIASGAPAISSKAVDDPSLFLGTWRFSGVILDEYGRNVENGSGDGEAIVFQVKENGMIDTSRIRDFDGELYYSIDGDTVAVTHYYDNDQYTETLLYRFETNDTLHLLQNSYGKTFIYVLERE